MHVSVASGTALSFFSVCNTSPPPSFQLAFCGKSPFDIPQCHMGFVRNCELHNCIDFLLGRVTRVFVRCESHDPTSPLLTMLLGQHIGLFSSFETSWQFLRGAFSLGKRNDIRQGLAASCDNSHWLVNPRRKTRFTWENTRSLEGWARHAFFLEKKYGLREQSRWTQDAFCLRKHKGI